jgi:hypothetical protein
MATHYDTLRVDQGVSSSMLKEVYESLRRRINDQNVLSDMEAAYAVLGNPESRQAYDLQIAASLRDEAIKRQQQADEVAATIRATEEAKINRLPEKEKNRYFELQQIVQRSASWSMSYKDLIFPYVGQRIGINTIDPIKFNSVKLEDVQQDFFTVSHSVGSMHIPYAHILKVMTAEEGGSIKTGIFLGIEARIFIEIFHMVVYKGASGFAFGMSMPVGD